MLDIAVVGASGVVGEQVLSALAASHLPMGEVRAFASRACKQTEVPFGERSLSIEDIAELSDGAFSLAFVCLPPVAARRVSPTLHARGTLVIDIGGSSGLEAPIFLPDQQQPELKDVVQGGGLRIPSAPGWILASLLWPLREAGITGVSGVLSLPATAAGRAGMEELGAQVVASFNGREPPQKVFPEGLAFDILAEDVPEDAWSAREMEAATEVEQLIGLSAERIGVSFCTSSIFSGMVAGLHLRGVSVETVEAALLDAPNLRAVQRNTRLRPRAIIEKGRSSLSWGRLRADPGGDGVHLWAVGDNLVGTGAVAVKAAEWLNQQGLFRREDA